MRRFATLATRVFLICSSALAAARADELQVSAQATGGSGGARRAAVQVRREEERTSFQLEVETFAAAQAPPRTGVNLSAELPVGSASLETELQAVPLQAGMGRLGGSLGLRVEGERTAWGASLLGRAARGSLCARCGPAGLLAVGLAAQLQLTETPGRPALHASAWATSLQGNATAVHTGKDMWTAFGLRTLDWAERWDVSASVRARWRSLELTPEIGLAQGASAGAWSARGALQSEVRWGRLGFFLGAAASHLWPRGWIGEGTAGLSLHFPDEREAAEGPAATRTPESAAAPSPAGPPAQAPD